tara:strand:- start:830 stop:1429 length:600 start_codon:yes stop_codon:yes gene_type:complete
MAKNILTGSSIFDSFQKLRSDANVPKDNFRWFADTINRNVKGVDRNQIRDQIASDPVRGRSRLFLGQMYMFFYNQPEYQTTLPYYDTFPLVLMLGRAKTNFFGINFHYIPPKRRLQMFLLLQQYRQGNRILLPYGTMKRVAKWKIFKSCFRRYKTSLISGNLINIPADDWPIAITLPVERFKKSSKAAIWDNTLREEQN